MRHLVLLCSLFATLAAAQGVEAVPPPSFTTSGFPDGGATAAKFPKPDPHEVVATWTFYFKGQGQGVVLADARLCTEIVKEGPDKNECGKEVPPEGVKAGSTVQVWQAYLVPQGDAVDDITVQLKQGDTVRETRDLKLKGESFRTRQWTGFRLPKPGDWTIVIARGSENLKALNVKVTK